MGSTYYSWKFLSPHMFVVLFSREMRRQDLYRNGMVHHQNINPSILAMNWRGKLTWESEKIFEKYS